MKNLSDIYRIYNCDKGNQDSFKYAPDGDAHPGHNYGVFYQPYFEKYIQKYYQEGYRPKMLEIGLWTGHSLLAHNEFFEGKIELYGVDIYNILDFDISKYPNMHIIFDDSESDYVVNQLNNNKYEIIIDDAAHTPHNQLNNIIRYSKMLTPDGIYILEDVHTSLWKDFMEELPYTDSMLYFLTTGLKPSIMKNEDYEWLKNHIKKIDMRIINKWESATAIITFN